MIPKKLLRLVIIDICVAVFAFVPSIVAYSEAFSYRCHSSISNVCVVPGPQLGVTLSTKYGTLRPLQDMAFRMFTLFANNGSIFLDVSGLAPSPDIALQFEAQSYGNGSFAIVIKGPLASGITADGADQRFKSVLGGWGSGVEIVYSKAISNDLLIVSYNPFGPGCILICSTIGPNWLPSLTFAFLLAILSTALFTLLRTGEGPKANSGIPTSSQAPLSCLPWGIGTRKIERLKRSP